MPNRIASWNSWDSKRPVSSSVGDGNTSKDIFILNLQSAFFTLRNARNGPHPEGKILLRKFQQHS
eukprot:03651_5